MPYVSINNHPSLRAGSRLGFMRETRVAKPRDERRSRESVGGAGRSPARSRDFAARLVASPSSRISRIKPKREPARRLQPPNLDHSRPGWV